VIVFDAEGGDNDIDRFANCNALLSEGAKVVSTFDGDVGFEEIEDGEIGEEMFGPVVVRVLAKPLEDFGEDQVADRGWVVRSWSRRSVWGVDCPLK